MEAGVRKDLDMAPQRVAPNWHNKYFVYPVKDTSLKGHNKVVLQQIEESISEIIKDISHWLLTDIKYYSLKEINKYLTDLRKYYRLYRKYIYPRSIKIRKQNTEIFLNIWRFINTQNSATSTL